MAMNFKQKYGYGVGHVFNDLCSAMWFTYLLIYFHHVLKFENTLAGLLLLIGQVADGLSTPVVGHEVDRVDDLPFCIRYGRRKTWHLIGTICVLVSFPFIFFGCIGCETASPYSQIYYFAPIVAIFQFGWAATQISHLAILPNLTNDSNERTELNAIRYAFTVLSTILVYGITWALLGIGNPNSQRTINSEDVVQFRWIVAFVVVVGVIFSTIFHSSTKEDNSVVNSPISITGQPIRMTWKDWLLETQFYQVALVYMATRLFCNISQAYIPLYLEDTLNLTQTSIAYIPLVIYISGFLTTTVMKPVNRKLGRKITFIIGCFLGLSGTLWVYLGCSEPTFIGYFLYVIAFLIGSGGSTMLVTSLSITADYIGNNVETGGFVYGAMSFTDKLSNGIVVMLIQFLTPYMSPNNPEAKEYFKVVLFYSCGGATLLGLIAILSLIPAVIGERKIVTQVQRSISETADNTPILLYPEADQDERV